MKTFKKIGLVFSVVAFAIACKTQRLDPDKVKAVNWNPTYAVPVLNSDLTVYNILTKIDDNNVVVIDSATRFIALVYDGEVVISDINTFVQLPSPVLSLGNVPVASGASFPMSGTLDFTPVPADVELYKMLLQSGNLVVNIDNSTFAEAVTVTLNIPFFKSGATSFSQTFNVSPFQNFNSNVALNGYEFDYTKTAKTFNEIDYTVQFSVGTSGVNAGTIPVSFSFSNLVNQRLKTYLGQRVIDFGNNEIELKIFGSTEGEGVFKLDSPLVHLDFSNTFGIPMEADLSNMRTKNLSTGTEFPFTFTPASLSKLLLNSSTNPDVPLAITSVTYDKSEVAQFSDIVNGNKKVFYYNPTASINPAGKDTNFINGNSELKINAEVELPLQGYAYNFYITDTVPFSGFTFPEGLESVLFVSGINNGFPIDVRFQLYFADSNAVVLDSLYDDFENPLMASGITDANGKVIESTFTLKDTEYDAARAKKLERVDRIILKASANSTESSAASQKTVKLFDYYKINTRLSMKFEINMDL